jgi:hypothetical protein
MESRADGGIYMRLRGGCGHKQSKAKDAAGWAAAAAGGQTGGGQADGRKP